MENLLPCPFCGEVPTLPNSKGTQYEMYCDCGMAMSTVQISDLMTIDEREHGWLGYMYKPEFVERAKRYVIENWNTRAVK